MNLKNELIAALPPFKNDWELITKKQGVKNIIDEILDAHEYFNNDYDAIYSFFDTGNIYTTCKKLWDFQRNELEYIAESGDDQSSRSPAAILELPDDCKHFALFTSGVLSAIQRNQSVNWEWFYRFASDTEVNFVTHVFVVVEDKGKEIWVDPCIRTFDNHRKDYLITKDVMALYRISGVSSIVPNQQNTVVVDKQTAFENFLYMTAEDMLILKSLMKTQPDITNGPVKQYFINQGFDWNRVLSVLNS
jgi:hypothetical protein